MNEYERNTAIVASLVYGFLLICGFVLFLFSRKSDPLYDHSSLDVAVWLVFWFSISPILLFMGIVIPWICAAYGSRAWTLVFTVAPGVLFVFLSGFLLIINDRNNMVYRYVNVPVQHAPPVTGAGPGWSPMTIGGLYHDRYRRSPAPLPHSGGGQMFPFYSRLERGAADANFSTTWAENRNDLSRTVGSTELHSLHQYSNEDVTPLSSPARRGRWRRYQS